MDLTRNLCCTQRGFDLGGNPLVARLEVICVFMSKNTKNLRARGHSSNDVCYLLSVRRPFARLSALNQDLRLHHGLRIDVWAKRPDERRYRLPIVLALSEHQDNWPTLAWHLSRNPAQDAGKPHLAQIESILDTLSHEIHLLPRDCWHHGSPRLMISLAHEKLVRAKSSNQSRRMTRQQELGAPACLSQPIDQTVKKVRMQSMINLLHAGKAGRIWVIQHRQERQRPHRAIRGVG